MHCRFSGPLANRVLFPSISHLTQAPPATAYGVFPLSDSWRWTTHTCTHALQPAGQLRVLLLYLELRTCRLGIRQCIDNLTLGSRKFGRTFEILQCLSDFALLQEQLRHSGNSNVAFRID